MQIQYKLLRWGKKGMAMAITLPLISACLLVFGSMMYWASSNAIQVTRNNLFNVSEAAAEAAVETVIAQMDHDFLYQSLTNQTFYQQLTVPQSGWPVQFTFSSNNIVMNSIGVNIGTTITTNLTAPFQGLFGNVNPCVITATATPQNVNFGMSATVEEQPWFSSIQVFQFAVFYNLDLDASPGEPMTIRGKVFSNGNIYLYPYATMTFNDLVISAKQIYTNIEDPAGDQQSTSGYVAPTFKTNWISNFPSLVMPIGTNNNPAYVESLLNLPSPIPGATNYVDPNSSNALYYPYLTADLIISNSPNGTNSYMGVTNIVNSTNYFIFCTNIFVWWQAGFNTTPRLTLLTNDLVVTNIPTVGKNKTNFIYAGYSFATNVNYYDFREQDQVDALQIDLVQFNTWLLNAAQTGGSNWDSQNVSSKTHHISSIYVYNNIQPASGNPGIMPAVRLVNGAQLPYLGRPDGLTVATPQPLYVLGNYNIQTNSTGPNSFGTSNTVYTVPAGLMGDAITILSTNWNDAKNAYKRGGSYSQRTPTATTINAACLEGIVQSTTVGSQQYYSGGLENFLRLEENWSQSITLTYNGSIVVMFPSIYATNFWQIPGNYYNPPNRNWSFDLLYTNVARVPPLSPSCKTLIRGQWTAY
jgi:hypothetical protein